MSLNQSSINDQAQIAAAISSQEAVEKSTKLDRIIQIGKGEVYATDAFYPYSESPMSLQTQAGRLSTLISANFKELDTSFAELPELLPEYFPNWVGDMASELAANSQTPAGMALMLFLSVAATCLQGKIEVEGLSRGHREPLSFWGVTVMPPGNLKTHVFNEMTKPLTAWAIELNNRTETDRLIQQAEVDIAIKRIEKLKKEVSDLGADDAARPATLQEIAKLMKLTQNPPRAYLPFTNDSTPEGIRDLLIDHGGRMAALSDEGGIFDTVSGLYNNGQANIDVLLKAYSHSDFSVTRSGNKTCSVKSPALSIGLTAQPATLHAMRDGKGTKGSFRGRGFIGRICFYIPRSLVGQRSADGRDEITETSVNAYDRGIRSMLELVDNKTNTGETLKYTYKLDAVARDLYREFYSFLESRHGTDTKGLSTDRDLAPIQDWTTKMQGAVLRIAGILHYAEHKVSDLAISAATMGNAIKIAKVLIPHTQEAMAMMGDDVAPKDKQATEIYKWIKENKLVEFKESDIAKVDSLKNFKELSRVLSVLERHGVITSAIKISTPGRPYFARRVNPDLKYSPQDTD